MKNLIKRFLMISNPSTKTNEPDPLYDAEAYVIYAPSDDLTSVEEKYFSRQMIIDEYYEKWKQLMVKTNKQSLISERNCIKDWVIINWAIPVTLH